MGSDSLTVSHCIIEQGREGIYGGDIQVEWGEGI